MSEGEETWNIEEVLSSLGKEVQLREKCVAVQTDKSASNIQGKKYSFRKGSPGKQQYMPSTTNVFFAEREKEEFNVFSVMEVTLPVTAPQLLTQVHGQEH